MDALRTTEELEAELGEQLRKLRLRKNLDQRILAAEAGVSLTALKNVESGKGATIRTLVRVVRALDRLDWLRSLAPVVSINPLQIARQKPPRQRASPRRQTR